MRLLQRFWPLLRPHRRDLLIALALLFCCTALFQVGPLLVRHVMDVDVPRHDRHGLYLAVILYILAQGGYLLGYYHQRLRLENVGVRVVSSLKARLASHVVDLPLSYFDVTPPGKLLSRVESDVESLRQMLAFTSVNVVGESFKLAVSLGVMVCIRADLSVVVLLALFFLAAVGLTVSHAGRAIFLRSREQAAEVSGFLVERLQAVPLIQAYSQQDATATALDQACRRKSNADVQAYWLGNTVFNTILLFETLGLCATLYWGGSLVLRSAVSIGTLLMYLEYLRRFFEPVYRLGDQLNVITRALACGERVFELLERPLPRTETASVPWKGLREGIEFHGVSFSYAQDGRDIPVLQDVSFHLPRGERWALVGPTGGGKTTILSLLLGFYEPQKGAILVDGIDVRAMQLTDLRRHCALVLQDTVIFPGTVFDNVTLGDPRIDEGQVSAAIRAAAADRLVGMLPQGAQTPLLNRGANLSSGERQLLAFARALARDPDILLLDEATASVDPATEQVVSDALRGLLRGRTAIIVAHRLSTVVDADRILFIDGGRIVEQGTHLELLATRGPYARLHALQSVGVGS